MNKVICALFILFIVILPIKGKESRQNIKYVKPILEIKFSNYRDTIDTSAVYYWYYIKVESNINKENKIKLLSKKSRSGKIDVYEKELWRSRLSGQMLPVGPFQSNIEAQNSMFYFKVASFGSDTMINTSDKELYWYRLKFEIPKRTHQVMVEPDYEIQKGNNIKFVQELKTSLQNKILFQSPSTNYEFVKELIRINFYRIKKSNFE